MTETATTKRAHRSQEKSTKQEEILDIIPQLFDESQKTALGHRKHATHLRRALYKLSLVNSQETPERSAEVFFNRFLLCVNRVLAVRKRDSVVDKCIKFVALFVSSLQETEGGPPKTGPESKFDQERVEVLHNMFTRMFISYMLVGVCAQDKLVRGRCTQILALIVDSISEMDDDIYEKLREKLSERLMDKEASVRLYAVVALAKFQGVDELDGEGVEASKDPSVQALLFNLRNDPSAQVRKACLTNIELSPYTIPYIVERIRDVDATIRRYVFKHVMKEIGDLRVFSISDRESILKWGLRDRDASVREACVKMLCGDWLAQCDNNILEFLTRIDVLSSSIIDECMEAFCEFHGDLNFVFDDVFWDNLTPETAVLVQAHSKYHSKRDNDDKLVSVSYLVEKVDQYSVKSKSSGEDEQMTFTFVVGRLLEIASVLDYADEVGRKAMLNCLLSYLMSNDVDDNVSHAFEVLSRVSVDEPDFIRLVLQVTERIRGIEREDDDPDSLTRTLSNLALNENELSEDQINLKCLVYVHNLLERVVIKLDDYPPLAEFFTNVLVPSMKNSDISLQIAGLACMMQYCLISQQLASQNMSFLITTAKTSGVVQVQVMAFRALFDVLAMYNLEILQDSKDEFLDTCYKIIEESSQTELKSVVIEGCAKLMLFRGLKDQKMLSLILEFYFSSDAKVSEVTLQCLAFFLPVFSYSSLENQKLLVESFASSFVDIADNDAGVAQTQIVSQVAEWADVRQLKGGYHPEVSYASSAVELLTNVQGATSQNVKVGVQFLSKLKISPCTETEADTLIELCDKLQNDIGDRTIIKAIDKLKEKVMNSVDNTAEDAPDEVDQPAAESEQGPQLSDNGDI